MIKKLAILFVLIWSFSLQAQIDQSLLTRSEVDTSKKSLLNMDATYNRPFLKLDKSPLTIGGYLEADYQYIGEDGVTDGSTFRFPRMTLFFASSLHQKIKFLAELELEEGGSEILIEFAAVDFHFHPLLILRGGVIMNPIGAFNQNHDGPKWDFVDRPIAMTQMLPATWSNVGFGVYGKSFFNKWTFGYETYLSNGFDQSIIENEENKTYLPASKQTNNRFEEGNGSPLISAKIAARHSKFGEIGLSYMGQYYNDFEKDGLILDDKRRLNVFAIDFNSTLPVLQTFITGEWAWINIDIPEDYGQQFGEKQMGGFIDFVQPIYKKQLLGFKEARINAICRLEYVDWNANSFIETGGNIGEDIWVIVPGLSLRLTGQTLLRFNYRIMAQQDILGNPPANTRGIQMGLATYF